MAEAAESGASQGSVGEEEGPSGRPRLDVDLDDVEFLCSLKLSLTKVSSLLGVSRSTIYRRMLEEGRVIGSYTQMTDTALDSIVQRLKVDHPNDGEVLIGGHLPDGVRERGRKACAIKRRVYSVLYTNYIWHIDSNHKLIRWRMVIHGAIDGYSRKIM